MREALLRLARNLAWLATGEVALKGGLFLAGIVVARGQGPAGMGIFTVAYGAALVVMQILASGQVEVLIRETARFPTSGRVLLAESRRHQLALAAAVLPVCLIGLLAIGDRALRFTLLGFLPYAFLRSWLISAGAVFKGLDRMEVEVAGRSLELAITLPLLALLSWLAAPIWCTGLAFTAGGAAGTAWVLRQLRALPVLQASPLPRGTLWREGLPFLGLATLSLLSLRGDAFLLAGRGVTQAEIGLYGVAAAVVMGASGLAQVLAVASYPTLARRAARNALGAGTVITITGAGMLLGVLLAGGLSAVRIPLITLFFGASFVAAAPVMAMLVWALPGLCVSMLLGVILAAVRRQLWMLGSNAVRLALLVTGCLVLVPRAGVRGCAEVVVAVQACSAVAHAALAIAAVRAAPRTVTGTPPKLTDLSGVG
ncbi:MAG: lipopolysaccharide biosynthesis protein [Acidobacteriota bacterium]